MLCCVVSGHLEQPRAPKSYPTVSERIFLAQKYHKIFNFFSGANGSLDVLDGVLTLLAVALSKEKEKQGVEEDEEHVRSSFTALTTADVAAVMAVVRSPQHRLILHERCITPAFSDTVPAHLAFGSDCGLVRFYLSALSCHASTDVALSYTALSYTTFHAMTLHCPSLSHFSPTCHSPTQRGTASSPR